MNDLISRQAAIETALTYIVEYCGAAFNEDMQRTLKDQLDSLLSVKQEPPWIPCRERLPEDLAEVNVTYVNHDPAPYYASIKDKPFTASAIYYKGNWYWYSSTCADYLGEYGQSAVDKVDDAIEITAWMPFPEPYRKDE